VQPYELFVGLRYTRAKRRNHFISFISMASMVGIAVGVMALIVVLSVMNGFQKELRARILGVASHVQITGFDGHLQNWQSVATRHARTKRHVRPLLTSTRRRCFPISSRCKGDAARVIVRTGR
jgi:lipoprotein-releasing system permease protein